MRRRLFSLVIGALILAVTGTGCWLRRADQEGGPPGFEEPGRPGTPVEPASETSQPLEVNFSESGNILNWDAKTESYTNDWTFLYEKPGNPALSVKLVFDENGICALNKGEEVCDLGQLNNGDRVELWGNRVGDQVTVVRLKRLPEP